MRSIDVVKGLDDLSTELAELTAGDDTDAGVIQQPREDARHGLRETGLRGGQGVVQIERDEFGAHSSTLQGRQPSTPPFTLFRGRLRPTGATLRAKAGHPSHDTTTGPRVSSQARHTTKGQDTEAA